MESIDAKALHQKITDKEDILLIDVREPWEHENFNIGGLLIPMPNIFKQLEKIPKNKLVIFYCQKGIRSGLVIQRLEQKFHYQNIMNLSGGMDEWKKIIK
jgi:adenylyltransferase/sulfurtransferase